MGIHDQHLRAEERATIMIMLQQGCSPAQIAGTLKRMWPDDLHRRVLHETIYNCIYAMPRGKLRKELTACLRRAAAKRMPRLRGQAQGRHGSLGPGGLYRQAAQHR